jgi:predicted ATPase
MPGYILTGTPGSGKTAILRMLETVGYPVVEEAATDVIALNQALGRDQPWDEPAFIDNIVALQRRRLDRVLDGRDGEIVFFDRSPVCTLALSRYAGLDVSRSLAREVDRAVSDGSYEKTVFFIRNQGFVAATAARRISFADSLVFERIHEQTYRDLGFEVADVPAGPLADRVALIRQAVDARP